MRYQTLALTDDERRIIFDALTSYQVQLQKFIRDMNQGRPRASELRDAMVKDTQIDLDTLQRLRKDLFL